MLIEVARQKGNYLPDLSFGTHFFQDLVEASIRYLPSYPMIRGPHSRRFPASLTQSARRVGARVRLDTLRVIGVPRENNGQILRVLMNVELDQAVAFLSPPQKEAKQMETDFVAAGRAEEEHWRWHHSIAQRIAAELDPQQFGVEAFYLSGSTKNATAGPQQRHRSDASF